MKIQKWTFLFEKNPQFQNKIQRSRVFPFVCSIAAHALTAAQLSFFKNAKIW